MDGQAGAGKRVSWFWGLWALGLWVLVLERDAGKVFRSLGDFFLHFPGHLKTLHVICTFSMVSTEITAIQRVEL